MWVMEMLTSLCHIDLGKADRCSVTDPTSSMNFYNLGELMLPDQYPGVFLCFFLLGPRLLPAITLLFLSPRPSTPRKAMRSTKFATMTITLQILQPLSPCPHLRVWFLG